MIMKRWRTTTSDSNDARGDSVKRRATASHSNGARGDRDEPATPFSPSPHQPENDAVQVLEKSPSKEEPVSTPTSPPNSCNPATPPLSISRQERRRKERERKKRERKRESVLYGLHEIPFITLECELHIVSFPLAPPTSIRKGFVFPCRPAHSITKINGGVAMRGVL
jgi:hypothetical protein